MSWKQADDIRKAPQAGSERCPTCGSRNPEFCHGYCPDSFHNGCEPLTQIPYGHSAPESGPPIGDVGGSDAFHDWPPESGKEGETNVAREIDAGNRTSILVGGNCRPLGTNETDLSTHPDPVALTPSPAQGAERLHGPFQRVDTIREHGPLSWPRENNNVTRIAICDSAPRLNILGYVLPEFADRIVDVLNYAHVTAAKDETILRLGKLLKDAKANARITRRVTSFKLTGSETFLDEHSLDEAIALFRSNVEEDQNDEVQRLKGALRDIRTCSGGRAQISAIVNAALTPETGGGKS